MSTFLETRRARSIHGRISNNLDAHLHPAIVRRVRRCPARLAAGTGMTQAQLAMASAISRPTLIGMEAGKGRADTLLRRVRMLGGTLTLSLPAREPQLAEGEMEMGIDL